MIFCKLCHLFLLNVLDQLMYLIEKPCLFMCGLITDTLLLLSFLRACNITVSIYF